MNATWATACVLWALCGGPAPAGSRLSSPAPQPTGAAAAPAAVPSQGWTLSALWRQSPAAQPLPAVARIVVPEKDGTSYGSGTLVDVHDRFGLVITNWHVVSEASGTIAVHFPDGFRSGAKVVKLDRDWDLAALAIWKPLAEPLPLSPLAPQPGQPLTIAGYGNGPYRMATGRCTQFLSPGPDFPSEIVELSAAARQGDSGGPILNDRGELAGVLFGESQGLTSGSHCGRVRMFLESVLAGKHAAPPVDATSPDDATQDASSVVNPRPDSLATHDPGEASDAPHEAAPFQSPEGPSPDWDREPAFPAEPDRPLRDFVEDDLRRQVLAEAESARRRLPSLPSRSTTNAGEWPAAADETSTALLPASAADWARAMGDSPWEQAKSVLAIVGLLAISLRLGRWFLPK